MRTMRAELVCFVRGHVPFSHGCILLKFGLVAGLVCSVRRRCGVLGRCMSGREGGEVWFDSV